MYRIYEFPLHEQSHAIYRLAVHLPGEEYVCFEEGSEEKMIDKNIKTTLTSWFDLNKIDKNACNYLYSEVPNFYVFNNINKTWTARKKFTKPVLNRMYFVNPKDKEGFYLRMLLLHVKGAKCYEDIRTYNGNIYSSFYEAAKARNLIKSDNECDFCLKEASEFAFPFAMCELFAYILIFHDPINSRSLFDKYKEHLFHPKLDFESAEIKVLKTINNVLLLHGLSLQDYDLPQLEGKFTINFSESEEDKNQYKENFCVENIVNTFNDDQKKNL